MAYEFRTQRRIEFVDTDMAGIVHFSNYFRYMEGVEHSFVLSLGIFLHQQVGNRLRGFARVRATCDYRAPLRYGDEVEIHLLVERVGETSIRYRFGFYRVQVFGVACEPELTAVGAMTVVCVTRGVEDDQILSTLLPDELTSRIEAAPPELLPSETT